MRQFEMLSSGNHALIKIAQVIALSDGSISEKEAQMIQDLPQRLGLPSTTEIAARPLPTLVTLAGQLSSEAERCMAARIAYLVAGVSRNPGDTQDINADERSAYRELLDCLSLGQDQLNEIEWSARLELKQGKNLVQLIGDALFGEAGWPDPSLMGPEIPGL